MTGTDYTYEVMALIDYDLIVIIATTTIIIGTDARYLSVVTGQ